MKKLLLMGALVGGFSVSGLTSTAKADHCSVGGVYAGRGIVGRRSFSYGSAYSPYASSYYRPRTYYSPRSYGGYGGYYSPRFSISVGSGYGFYGRRSLGSYNRHHHHHH